MSLNLQVGRGGDVAVLWCEGPIISGLEAEYLEEKSQSSIGGNQNVWPCLTICCANPAHPSPASPSGADRDRDRHPASLPPQLLVQRLLTCRISFPGSFVTANRFPPGEVLLATAPLAFKLCEWAGIWSTVKATCSAPPVCPRTRFVSPTPWPKPTGRRPRRSGSAKVVYPSPP